MCAPCFKLLVKEKKNKMQQQEQQQQELQQGKQEQQEQKSQSKQEQHHPVHCVVCAAKVREKDFLELQTAGTGFSGSAKEKGQAQSYKPMLQFAWNKIDKKQ